MTSRSTFVSTTVNHAQASALVRGIPHTMTIGDLREFFYDFIEREDMICRFHFLSEKDFAADLTSRSSPACALVVFPTEAALKSFLGTYHGREWESKSGQRLGALCVVDPVIDADPSRQQARSTDYQTFLDDKVTSIVAPPSAIPQGNVGTSLRVIHESIQKCLIPSNALQKMGIDFRGALETRKRPKYNRVQHLYERDDIPGIDKLIDEEFAEEAVSLSDDVEEWDRWDALHGDEEDEEERYLYEEKIEKKWEKGGSGLVHYTDAIYWNKEKGGMDEQEMLKEHGDDWALDHSKWPMEKADLLGGRGEAAEASLRAARLQKLKASKKREREENDTEERFLQQSRKRAKHKEAIPGPPPARKPLSSSFSGFDLYSSAPSIGKAYLEAYGWREGEPIGSGAVAPVADNLKPVVERRGLGYEAPKVGRPYKSLINKDLGDRFRKPAE